MVKRYTAPVIGMIIMLMAMIIPSQSIFAAYTEDTYKEGDIYGIIEKYNLEDDEVYVADDAGIFSESEIELLEERAKELEEELDVNFLIITGRLIEKNDQYITVEEAFSTVEYVRYKNDEYGRGSNSKGYTVLVIDMVTRDFAIQSHCWATASPHLRALNNASCDSIIDDMTSDLSAGDYYDAMEIFFQKSAKYMDKGDNYNPDAFIYKWWFTILASIFLSSLIIAPFVFKSEGKMTVDSQNFIVNGPIAIVDRRDTYIRTEVTRTRRSSSSSGGGGGGGGGGGSHGGGHGKF